MNISQPCLALERYVGGIGILKVGIFRQIKNKLTNNK